MKELDELQKALDNLTFWWKTEKLTVCDAEMTENWVVETLDPQNFNSFLDALDEFCQKWSVFRQSQEASLRKLEEQAKTQKEIRDSCECCDAEWDCNNLCFERWVSPEDVKQVFGRAFDPKCDECKDIDYVPNFPLKCGATKLWGCEDKSPSEPKKEPKQ